MLIRLQASCKQKLLQLQNAVKQPAGQTLQLLYMVIHLITVRVSQVCTRFDTVYQITHQKQLSSLQ